MLSVHYHLPIRPHNPHLSRLSLILMKLILTCDIVRSDMTTLHTKFSLSGNSLSVFWSYHSGSTLLMKNILVCPMPTLEIGVTDKHLYRLGTHYILYLFIV